MPDIRNFSLLGFEYFCIPINIPELCSGMQLSYLETVQSFQVFLFFNILNLKELIIFLKLINLLIYFWLCWVFVSVRGLSLVAASGGHSSQRCTGLSLSRPLLLRSIGSRRARSVVVAHGPSCSAACGIFPDQGSNPCPLHWQADSQPLHHQGSPPFRSWFKDLSDRAIAMFSLGLIIPHF